MAAVNRRAACSGCSRSWLAAAMKRVLPRLAASASARLASQLGGALDHALLQRLGRLAELAVAFAQRLGGAHARRHVVAGGDEAGAGQRVQSQLDDAIAPGRDLVGLRRIGPAQEGDDLRRRAELRRRGADRHGRVGERQQRRETVIEDLQPAVAVEGGDAHADMVERVAQDLVVVADRLRGLVDDGARAARNAGRAGPGRRR